VDAQYTDLKLPVDIVIGTVPLREPLRSFPAVQPQSVITNQPLSAPPVNENDINYFDLGTFYSHS